MSGAPGQIVSRAFNVRDYDLAATLNSGQAFRWKQSAHGWEGVIGNRWVLLEQNRTSITCETIGPAEDWHWLRDYLQLDSDLSSIIVTFPDDPPMKTALSACFGLRLLKQEPWEVLASFILSSTKQIVQIRQVVAALANCFGKPVAVPSGHVPVNAFPSPQALAAASEAELRACKMGFRAPYLKAAAEAVASGALDLEQIGKMPVERARIAIEELLGVGPKIANCVLLSAYNFPTAFPLDVWVLRALRDLYFPRKRPSLKRLREFSVTHFGPWSGYAQLYLFHYVRVIRTARAKSRTPGKVK